MFMSEKFPQEAKKIMDERFGHDTLLSLATTDTDREVVETFGLNEIGMIKSIVPENWEQVLYDFYSLYEKLHYECSEPYEGIQDLIVALRAKGFILALITGKGERSCQITLNAFGMEHNFDEILTGSESENVKAQSLKLLLKKYDLLPAQCVYIGDAVSDVSEAGKAGIICLSALWGTTAKAEELKIINADYIFETVGELRDYLLSMPERISPTLELEKKTGLINPPPSNNFRLRR
ncbi:HAD family hydrolase [Blautia pseudococcoides]|uniref:Phosphoglycolate phosphatase n=2 Tax=Blautia pseudococcoides TaxID=1796616 RepID=A0A1V0QEL5_9FIRM|nr:phosphoglycolate phosphatase [Blautia pseudococcoides]ASU28638.1 HAD family hydrolase [Blautia pseudococcoides]QQQ93398.1 HAD family hydrolase [Blautia pseudococcoides]